MIIAEGRVGIKWYEPIHLDQLCDLHLCCFPKEDWKPQDFQRFVEKPERSGVVKVLADEKNVVYGSLLYTLDAQSCRIRRVAVWPDYRRQGLASFGINSLCGPRSPLRRRLFLARVRETNTAAQLFFKSGMGFQFDPNRQRERDEAQNCDYYEFTFVKANVPVISVNDD